MAGVLLLNLPLNAADDKPVKPFNGTDPRRAGSSRTEDKSKWAVGRSTIDDKEHNELAVTVDSAAGRRRSRRSAS